VRAVGLVRDDLKPSAIMTRAAFLNAIRVNTAIGGSTNAPPHLQAIARHMGVELQVADWQAEGLGLPLLVNCQPAGKYLGESFHRAGGVPAVMGELLAAGLLDETPLTVTGSAVGTNVGTRRTLDTEVIMTAAAPLRKDAGFRVISGNLFDSALMKTSVISADFQERFLAKPDSPGVHRARAIVFDGPEDYHDRINEPELAVDEECILFMRNVGPIGYPGSAEVVNMLPPDALVSRGIHHLPTVGDGRQSGTSESPSILNASPEALAGGGLAILQTGDTVVLDVNTGQLNVDLPDDEIARRWSEYVPPPVVNNTPWQEVYRSTVGCLASGGCMEMATRYRGVCNEVPRHNH